ncbi:unnamed protein product [Arabis nemorensis]|uniref:Uncharacterized protein n=1 Tax=Arabis nemorensis TaxID=586526 RepID=A0A565BXB3_9BRAS|nr:unnamed protein product [Arabis nemorensis]
MAETELKTVFFDLVRDTKLHKKSASQRKGPGQIDSRVESLLKDLETKLYKISDDEFKVAALRELKKEELIDYFNEYIKIDEPKKQSLSICVYGSNQMASDKEIVVSPFIEIEDIVGFRKSQPLYGSLEGCSQLKL